MSSPPPPAPPPPPSSSSPPESTAAKTTKRYEGLMTIRTKAIKGKGAWYWTHLEPILVNNNNDDTNAVKLRCCLCDAVFSASNPSRTASEHLKRGTCPNFNNDLLSINPQPISSISPTGIMTSSHRKRNSGGRNRTAPPPVTSLDPGTYPTRPGSEHDLYSTRPEPEPDYGSYPTRPGWVGSGSASGSGSGSGQVPAYVQLSGGKEDLNALAMLEDSVKRLKSPKTLPGQTLTKAQIDASLELLTDWLYENCGSVGFGVSCVTHPKFKVFLNQLGLPAISSKEIAGNRLDSKFLSVKSESDARIRDALFFQLSSNGWKSRGQESQEPGSFGSDGSNGSNGLNYRYPDEKLVNLSVNLPNGTRVFRRGVFANGYVFAKYAEDVLMETIVEICGNNLEKCVGIVSDKFKSTALTSIESQHQWMINLCCQYQGVCSLVKDFSKELPLFKNVVDGCYKVASFVNTSSHVRNLFLKYQFQESGRARLLRVPFGFVGNGFGFEPVFDMVEDVLTSSRTLQLVLHDEGYQKFSMEDRLAREVEETMRNPLFWREIEAVHSLVTLVKDMAQEIEKERPRIGQCLPLWEEVRVKIRDWCVKFQMNESVVDKVFDKRFKRNYHPAWAAAFILDPFYLIKDRSGKYLPPFKYLTPDQEKDVDKLITRLVSREEAHIALMELMKWRTDGLDPVYAQAVQLKQRDPVTGKMRIANPQSSRLVWETYLTEFTSLRKVAVRLIFLHATSCGFKSNSSFSKWARSRTGVEKAQKLMFIAANSRIERRDLCYDDEKDADFNFAVTNGADDNNMINEVLFDASSP